MDRIRNDDIDNKELKTLNSYNQAVTDEIVYIRWTFIAAMHQTSQANKEKYSELKNLLLSYKNEEGKRIRNTEYRRYSIFYSGKKIIAKITIRQKLLKILFPKDGTEDEWIEYKLRSMKTFREACAYIKNYADENGWQVRPRARYRNYAELYPYLTNVILVKRRSKHLSDNDYDKQNDDDDDDDDTDFDEYEKSDAKVMVEAINLVSCEHYDNKDGTFSPLMKNVSLSVKEGDIMGISGDNKNVVKILCEVLGQMRAYYKGFLRVGEVGSFVSKRTILSHTYYLDGDAILYDRMTVLEQVLFTLYNKKKDVNDIERQRETLDILVDCGLREIALKKISSLTKGERIQVCIVIAGLSDSPIIMANLLEYEFTQEEVQRFAELTELLREREKTVIIATMQPKFIGMVCNMATYLKDGEVEYTGTVDELVKEWDKVVCLIKGNDCEKWAEIISNAMAGYKCVIEGDTLFVRNHTETEFDISKIYQVLASNAIIPDVIKFNKGRVENSFNEISENR